MKPNFFLAITTLGLALSACGQKTDAATAPQQSAPIKASAPVAASKPEVTKTTTAQNVSAKLQGYIACYNQIDGQAHRTIARYASWVSDMKAGPTGKEQVVYGLYALDAADIAKCRETFAKMSALKPTMATLDAAAEVYINTLTAMGNAVQETHTYYDRENHKDDKFAKGITLHAPLAASFEAFIQASNTFSSTLDLENDLVLNAKLADIEKTQGRKLPYFEMAVMNKAKQLSTTLGEETFDPNRAGEQLAAFEIVTDEALAYAKAHTTEQPQRWPSFAANTEEMRKAAKERLRRVRDKVPYNEGEKMMLKPGSGWMVEGSIEKMFKAYNALVSASNGM
jgi:hypothetical protein